jgi:hypothetical protein
MWKNKTYKIVQYVFMYNMNLFFHFFAEVVGSTCLFAAFFLREGMLLIFSTCDNCWYLKKTIQRQMLPLSTSWKLPFKPLPNYD